MSTKDIRLEIFRLQFLKNLQDEFCPIRSAIGLDHDGDSWGFSRFCLSRDSFESRLMLRFSVFYSLAGSMGSDPACFS